ncbi:hypothetical protein J7E79_04000 [Bacillus sp. ISL-40]|uniref:hypothetical protein n=1 Tax=Bacillus sp. ISL-40 TaxID=2819126 RepID=UPI001BEC07BD|nr:hypothetical protein [Bacillus sp. ISL-40]MBT2696585.1 hypothetical protein [Bacillus sp. ISL-40]
MFNEYGVYQTMKLRQEETEMKARNAWKFEDFQKETFLEKVVKKWNEGRKSSRVQPNCCCCAC